MLLNDIIEPSIPACRTGKEEGRQLLTSRAGKAKFMTPLDLAWD